MMTRVNVVPPSELHWLHLTCEYSELPRLYNMVRQAIRNGERPNDKRNPQAYTRGTGHCRFFYPRLGYIRQRLAAVAHEIQNRSGELQFEYRGLDYSIGPEWFGQYTPTAEAIAINRQRIAERSINLNAKNNLVHPRYHQSNGRFT